jgi:hypothetical protein
VGALPRPDLPPGPRRDLDDALHDLHHHAGWPSLRVLARQAGCSHTTVSAAFSTPRLPTWGLLELLVEAMHGDTGHFHQLWLAAGTPDVPNAPDTQRIAGRRDELAVVRHHLESGTGLLLVTGEAGIGKTRLVEVAAATTDVFVATANCLPLSRQVPLLPVIEALRGFHAAAGGSRVEAALADCPGYVGGIVARLLPELDEEPGDESSDEWGRSRLLSALHSLLQAVAAHGDVGLVLEDLHWADPSTLDVVEHLVSRPNGLPFVGTWRLHDPGTAPDTRDWLARVRRLPTTEVELGPLSREETATQLVLLLGDAADDRMGSIWRRAQGHPLFVEQLAAHPATGESLPARLADLIDARLLGLSGPPWDVARVLGVADRTLPVSLLAEVATLPAPTLTGALRMLADRRLLATTSDDRVAGLRHPLIAEGVRRRLVPGERTSTHRRLAVALGGREGSSPAEVAEHWRAAGDTAAELGWRVRAAQDAQRRTARAQEVEHWLRALEIWPADQPGALPLSRGSAELALVQALEGAGREDASLPRVLSLLDGDTLTRHERFRAAFLAAAYTWGPGGPDEALRLLDELALEFAGERSRRRPQRPRRPGGRTTD